MKKIIFIVIAVLLLLGVVFFVFNSYIYNEKQGDQSLPLDYKNTTFVIDGDFVTLKNVVSEVTVPESSFTTTTTFFGNELFTDLDGDGSEDVVFILTQETGGTGFFYYLVGALNTPKGYVGTQAVFIGDRIAPQTINKGTGRIIIVNYADRKPGEPFTTQPSIGKSLHLLLDVESLQFGEVAQNFEGEANPSLMTLPMKKWNWISALYNDGRETKPKISNKFTLTFEDGGKFFATTDCNAVQGSYKVNGTQITFDNIVSTKMYCENSQESDFTTFLQNSTSFHFTSKGELILDLKFDSGSVVFR